MLSNVASVANSYAAQRKDPKTFFSYGLLRRFREIRSEFLAWQPNVGPNPRRSLIVDLGCAGGEMLERLCEEFPDAFEKAVGIDLFRNGPPPTPRSPKVELVEHHLAKDFPYPFESRSVDFAIVSAYLKHNPAPALFLSEVQRILKPNGRAVILDPTPLVVRLGMFLGYFDPKYTMSAWSAKSLTCIFQRDGIGLRILRKRRYWLAPNRRMFELGIERAVPEFIRDRIGLHQCVVLARSSD